MNKTVAWARRMDGLVHPILHQLIYRVSVLSKMKAGLSWLELDYLNDSVCC